MENTTPRADTIHSMFSEIASRYDRANTVMSFGIHHLWRKKLVRWSGAKAGDSVLDCATGTGDLAIEFKRAVGYEGHVIGTDFCEEMLKPAPAKAARAGLRIEFHPADVLQLPFTDHSFDISSIAFGIRNVSDPLKALSELSRVVKPGGQVMVLEFGQPFIPIMRDVFQIYSEAWLPRIGGWLTGQKQAYEYLQKSSAKFPCAGQFISLMKQTGQFKSAEFRALTGGIAYIYKGIVA